MRGGDDRQPGSERFETGVGKRFVNRGQDERVRGREHPRHFLHRSEKAHPLRTRQSAPVASTGDEQGRTGQARLVDRRDGEPQPFPLPAGTGEEHREVAVAELEFAARSGTRFGLRGKGRHAIVNDVDTLRRIPKVPHDLRLHHARIGDDQARAVRAEKLEFQRERLAVLGAELAQPPLPRRLESRAPLQPRGMDAVARAVGVAGPDALQAEKEIALFPGTPRDQLIGEFFRRVAGDPHMGEGPRDARPFRGEKHAFVPRHDRLPGEAAQVGLRTTGA